MARVIRYHWHLRELMAANGMFSTTDLLPRLAERSIDLHPSQVWRLVSGVPERLNLQLLAALCDILGCTPSDLIEPYVQVRTQRLPAAVGQRRVRKPADPTLRPTPAKIVETE